MKVTVLTATLLAMISAAKAQTAGFDAITAPAKDEIVSACADYTINWEYTDAYPGLVTIQLLQGATPTTLQLGLVLASHVKNSDGAYTWSVDCSLGADATYSIKIISQSDPTGATFQYSNPFSIKASISKSTVTFAATTAYPTTADVVPGEELSSTLFSAARATTISCGATLTDCSSRLTVISSSVYTIISSVGALGGSASRTDTTLSTAAPVGTGAASPNFPMSNATTLHDVAGATAGTGSVPTKAGSGSAAASLTTVTADADCFAGAGAGIAVLAALVTAFFTL